MLIELNQEKSTAFQIVYDVFIEKHIGYIRVHQKQNTTSFVNLPNSNLHLTESDLRSIADAMTAFAIINKYNQHK